MSKKNKKNKQNSPIQNFTKKAKNFSSNTSLSNGVMGAWGKCGHKVTEIIPNLFLGSYSQVKEMIVDKNVDVLVPLDSLHGGIWDWGFRGEIHYCPIEDYETLPFDVFENLCDKILEYISSGKKVGLFCMGGHGRTGYVAAGVLGLYGIEDPFQTLWTEYCSSAVESYQQLEEVCILIGNNHLLNEYKEFFLLPKIQTYYRKSFEQTPGWYSSFDCFEENICSSNSLQSVHNSHSCGTNPNGPFSFDDGFGSILR